MVYNFLNNLGGIPIYIRQKLYEKSVNYQYWLKTLQSSFESSEVGKHRALLKLFVRWHGLYE
jgi:hypothetical protein